MTIFMQIILAGLFCLIYLVNVSAQCSLDVNLTNTGNGCVGHDTLAVTGAHGAAQIVWLKNNVPFDTTTALLERKGHYAAGFGAGDLPNMTNKASRVYVDRKGNVYIADTDNDRIIKFVNDSTGIVVAGGNGQGSAANQLNDPYGMFVDSAGNLYVADKGNRRVQKFPPGSSSATNGFTVAGGNGLAGGLLNMFDQVVDVYVDGAGNLYALDRGLFRLVKFPPGSTSATFGTVYIGGGGGAVPIVLPLPEAMCVDTAGAFYISVNGNAPKVVKFPAGTPVGSYGITVAGGNSYGAAANQFIYPIGVALAADGTLYVCDSDNDRIQMFPSGSDSTTNGITVAGTGNEGSALNELHKPWGIALDSSGRLYVAEYYNRRVMRFPKGSLAGTNGYTFAGQYGTKADSIHFQYPNGVFVDKHGYLYVTDGGANCRVMKFPPNSNYATPGVVVAGGNGQGTAANQFYNPTGVFVNDSGYIYVVDAGAHRVQKFPPGSNSTTNGVTIAGNGLGTGPTQLNGPTSLWVDSVGNVFVCDKGNHRIQKFLPGSAAGDSAFTVAGGNGGASTLNALKNPFGVCVDSYGNIYVADYDNHRVIRFPANSSPYVNGTMVAGGNGNGSTPVKLSYPTSVFIDMNNNLYVMDMFNYRIQKFPFGSTSATPGITLAGGNGPGMAANQMGSSYAITLDSSGYIYSADAGLGRVMRWSQYPTSLGIADTTYQPLNPGSYSVITTATNGCTDTTNVVVVGEQTKDSIAAIICTGFSYNFGGQTLNISGVYSDTLLSVSGCDSIVTLTLQVQQMQTVNLNQNICQGGSYFFNGQNLTTTGIYLDTISGVNCDTVVSLNLQVIGSVGSNITASVCSGNSYFFNGQNLTTAGVYKDTLVSSTGCDSIITLTLQIQQMQTVNQNQSICQGTSYFFNGQNLTVAGIYLDTLDGINCDTIVTLNLSVINPVNTSLTASVCPGNSYYFNGQNLTTAGVYKDTLVSSNNCDSIITLQLQVLQVQTTSLSLSICQGESYLFNGQALTNSGVYLDTLSGVNCDTVITLTLTVNPLPIVALSIPVDTLCANDPTFSLTGGTPSGGFYSGLAVTAGNFNPAVFTGVNTVTYNYTDVNTCSSSATDNIEVVVCNTVDSCQALFAAYPDSLNPGYYYAYNLSTGTALTYIWDFGDGATSNQQYPSHAYAQPGIYYVCLTVNNSSGCTSTYCDSSFVVFKTEGGLMTYFNVRSPTGISDVSIQPFIVLYPNPATTQLYIHATAGTVTSVELYDVIGRVVEDAKEIGHGYYDVSLLPAGVYVAAVKAGNYSKMIRWIKL